MIDRNDLVNKTAIAIGDCLCSEETICATCGVEAERAVDFLVPLLLEMAADIADECYRQNGVFSGKPNDDIHAGIRYGSEAIASAIRALISKVKNDL